MSFKINDELKLTCKLLINTEEGPETINATNEPATVKKLCKDEHYYVETQHGVHYVHSSKLSE